MSASHFRNLQDYRLALKVTAELYAITRRVPYEARPVVRQLIRAGSSVVLNIAEGAGEFRPLEKARIYRIARRSSWETSAALDVLCIMKVLSEPQTERIQGELNSIGAMLTTMSKKFQEAAESGIVQPKPKRRKGVA